MHGQGLADRHCNDVASERRGNTMNVVEEFLGRLPAFDANWNLEMQVRWFSSYDRLLDLACREPAVVAAPVIPPAPAPALATASGLSPAGIAIVAAAAAKTAQDLDEYANEQPAPATPMVVDVSEQLRNHFVPPAEPASEARVAAAADAVERTGVGRKGKQRVISDEDIEAIRQLHEKGLSAAVISSRLGVPIWAVYTYRERPVVVKPAGNGSEASFRGAADGSQSAA